MKELSLHVYDLMENSIAAKASLIELTITDSIKDNVYSFMIKDNSCAVVECLMLPFSVFNSLSRPFGVRKTE